MSENSEFRSPQTSNDRATQSIATIECQDGNQEKGTNNTTDSKQQHMQHHINTYFNNCVPRTATNRRTKSKTRSSSYEAIIPAKSIHHPTTKIQFNSTTSNPTQTTVHSSTDHQHRYDVPTRSNILSNTGDNRDNIIPIHNLSNPSSTGSPTTTTSTCGRPVLPTWNDILLAAYWTGKPPPTNVFSSPDTSPSTHHPTLHSTTVQQSSSKLDNPTDSESDDDGFKHYTIILNPKHITSCLHSATTTKSYKPQRFINFPYRQTILSLLGKLRTDPADNFAIGHHTIPGDGPQVYACYQHHWNPKLNFPVLTLVACCNTTITNPIFSRTDPDQFELKFMTATQEKQETFTFKLPIFSTVNEVKHTILMELGPHFCLPDSMTSWIIRKAGTQDPITCVKIWHLSTIGCHTLHNQGIHQPHKPYYEAETHILGLTGRRRMPYHINQHNVKGTILELLDNIDMGNIGYKKYAIRRKPIIPTTSAIIEPRTFRTIPKPAISPSWYFEGNQIITPHRHNKTKFSFYEPVCYPPPIPPTEEEYPDPELFKHMDPPYRFPVILPGATVQDMLDDAQRKDPTTCPMTTLMKYFNLRKEDLETCQRTIQFTQFLMMKEMPPHTTNGLCQFFAHSDGLNTGERYLIHKTWLPMSRHPMLREDTFPKLEFRRPNNRHH